MGLFRGLTVVLVGFFVISLLKNNMESVEKVPLVGRMVSENVERYRAEIIVVAIALVIAII